MTVTCQFRFEARPERETVELDADHHKAVVCEHCLILLTVHRRIHEMKIEQVIVKMSER